MKHTSADRDMLSNLPDCLLHCILSFLGARQLVQTSALSRRWRHLWRDVPCLAIDPCEFQEAAAATRRKCDKRDDLKEWARFEKFVDSLVLHHGADLPLDVLRLHVVDPPRDHSRQRKPLPDGSRWVRRCLECCRPAVLDIHGDYSNTPVSLRRMGQGTDLSRLTTLRLSEVGLSSGFGDLLGASGCPRLERLELKRCEVGFEEVVTSSTLKSLVVDRSWTSRALPDTICPRIEVPGLASLRLVLGCADDVWVYDVPSLVEASICNERPRAYDDDEYKLLSNLYNVTRLELSSFPPLEKVMPDEERKSFPKFRNLTSLLLHECDLTGEGQTTLELFLQNAPNLEKLTLQYCKLPGGSKKTREGFKAKKASYRCLNLKFTEIKYRKKHGVAQVVDLLLGVSKNLQKDSIVLSKD